MEDNSDVGEEVMGEEPQIYFYNDTDNSASPASFWGLVPCKYIENISCLSLKSVVILQLKQRDKDQLFRI